MKLFLHPLFILWGVVFFNHTSHADMLIEPVQLYLSEKAKQRSATLTFDAVDEKQARNFEVKAVKWTQNEHGQDVYEPDSSIMINPKTFVIKPNTKQLIRVGFNQPIASLGLKKEMAWRVIFTEIPAVANETGVNFALNISIPFFVGKQSDTNVVLKLKKNVNTTLLNVYNAADSHVQIKKLSILDQNKKEVFKLDNMKYLLAKSQSDLELGSIKLAEINKYTILMKTDKNDEELRLKIME